MVKMIERLLPENVRLQSELHARGSITADQGQMEQVLLNLAVNAHMSIIRRRSSRAGS
jgi:nitrogen-specific signal transduction histidine kinase